MNILQSLRTALESLQKYGSQYFIALYNTSLCFWKIPNLPTGSNVVTGAFAFYMIYTARGQMSQDTNLNTMSQIVFYGILMLTIACGLLVIFDPTFAQNRVTNWQKLVSTVCIGSILGCIFIVLDAIVPWIDSVLGFANYQGWTSDSADGAIALAAAFFSFIVLLVNSTSKLTAFSLSLGARCLAWSAVILALVALGVDLFVMRPLPFSVAGSRS